GGVRIMPDCKNSGALSCVGEVLAESWPSRIASSLSISDGLGSTPQSNSDVSGAVYGPKPGSWSFALGASGAMPQYFAESGCATGGAAGIELDTSGHCAGRDPRSSGSNPPHRVGLDCGSVGSGLGKIDTSAS